MSGSEIEYLEEYKDLICPDVRDEQKRNIRPAPPPHDEDSSSIDQDIFESLFEDNSDEDNVPTNKKFSSKISREDRASLDSLDMLCKDIGEQLSVPTPNALKTTYGTTGPIEPDNFILQQPTTSSSETQLQKLSTTGGKQSLLKAKQTQGNAAKAVVPNNLNVKTKSIATVRPTLQQQQQQRSQKSRLSSILTSSRQKTSPTDGPSTSKASLSANTQTGKKDSTSVADGSGVGAAISTPSNISQPTIFKLKKHHSKDPTKDPLSLDDIPDNLDYDTDSNSLSLTDISGDSYVSLSDLDEDTRNIIDLSNDSLTNATNHEPIRNFTPSPTVSEFIERHYQHKSDFEDYLSLMSSSSSIGSDSNKTSHDINKSLTIVSNWKIKNILNSHGKIKTAETNSQKIDLSSTVENYKNKFVDATIRNTLDHTKGEALMASSQPIDLDKGSQKETVEEDKEQDEKKQSHDYIKAEDQTTPEMQQNQQNIKHKPAISDEFYQVTKQQKQECKMQKQAHIHNFVNDNTLEPSYVYDIAMDEPIMEEIITTDELGSEEDRASKIIMESLEASKLKKNIITIESVEFIENTKGRDNTDDIITEDDAQTKKLKELKWQKDEKCLKMSVGQEYSELAQKVNPIIEEKTAENNKNSQDTMDMIELVASHHQSTSEQLANKKKTITSCRSRSFSNDSPDSDSFVESKMQIIQNNIQFNESMEGEEERCLQDFNHSHKKDAEISITVCNVHSKPSKMTTPNKRNGEDLFTRTEEEESSPKNHSSCMECREKKHTGASPDRTKSNEKCKPLENPAKNVSSTILEVQKEIQTKKSLDFETKQKTKIQKTDNENITKSSTSEISTADKQQKTKIQKTDNEHTTKSSASKISTAKKLESKKYDFKKTNEILKSFGTNKGQFQVLRENELEGKSIKEIDSIGSDVKNVPGETKFFLEKLVNESGLEISSEEDHKNLLMNTFETDALKSVISIVQSVELLPLKVTGGVSNTKHDNVNYDTLKGNTKDTANENCNILKTDEFTKYISCNNATNESKDNLFLKTAVLEVSKSLTPKPTLLEPGKGVITVTKQTFQKKNLETNTIRKYDKKSTDGNFDSCAVNYYKSIKAENNDAAFSPMPKVVNDNSSPKSEMSLKLNTNGEKINGKSPTTSQSNLTTETEITVQPAHSLVKVLFVQDEHKNVTGTLSKELLKQKVKSSPTKKSVCDLDQKLKDNDKSPLQNYKDDMETYVYGNEIPIKQNTISNDEKSSLSFEKNENEHDFISKKDEINQSTNFMINRVAIEKNNSTENAKTSDTINTFENMPKRKRHIRSSSSEVSKETANKKKSKVAMENDTTKRLLRQRGTETGTDVEKQITETMEKSKSAEPLNDYKCVADLETPTKVAKRCQKIDRKQTKSPGASIKSHLQGSPKLSTISSQKEKNSTHITKKPKSDHSNHKSCNTNVNDITEQDNVQNRKRSIESSRNKEITSKSTTSINTNLKSIANTENDKDLKVLSDGDGEEKLQYSQNKNKKIKVNLTNKCKEARPQSPPVLHPKTTISTKLSPASKLVPFKSNEKECNRNVIKAERKPTAKIPKLLGFGKSGFDKSETSPTPMSIENRNTQVISSKKKQITHDESKEPPKKVQRLEDKHGPVDSLKCKPGNVALVKTSKIYPKVNERQSKVVKILDVADKVRKSNRTRDEDIHSDLTKLDLSLVKMSKEDSNLQKVKEAQNLDPCIIDNRSTTLSSNKIVLVESANPLQICNTSSIAKKQDPNNESFTDLTKGQCQEPCSVGNKNATEGHTVISYDIDSCSTGLISTRGNIDFPRKDDNINMENSPSSAINTMLKKKGSSSLKKDKLIRRENALSEEPLLPPTIDSTPKSTGNVLTFAEWLRSQKPKEQQQRPLDSDSSTPSDMERALIEEGQQSLLSPSLELSKNKNVKSVKGKKKSSKILHDHNTTNQLSHSVIEESTNESPTMRINQKPKKSELDVLKDSMPSDMLQLVENHKDNVRVLKKRSIVTPVTSTSTPVTTVTTKAAIQTPGEVLKPTSSKAFDSGKNVLETQFKVPLTTTKRTDINIQGSRKQTKTFHKYKTNVGKVGKIRHRGGKSQQIKIKNLHVVLDEDFVRNYFKKLKEEKSQTPKYQENLKLEKEKLVEVKKKQKTLDKVKEKEVLVVCTKDIKTNRKNELTKSKDTKKPISNKCGEMSLRTNPEVIQTSIPTNPSKRISKIKGSSAALTVATTSQGIIGPRKNDGTISTCMTQDFENKSARSVETALSASTLPSMTSGAIQDIQNLQKNAEEIAKDLSSEIKETVHSVPSVVGRAGGVLTIPLEHRRPPPSVTGIRDIAKRPTTTITPSLAATNSQNIEIRDKTGIARVLCSDLIKPMSTEGVVVVNKQHDKTVIASSPTKKSSTNSTVKVNDSISTSATKTNYNNSEEILPQPVLEGVISHRTDMNVDLPIIEPKLEIEYDERNTSNIALIHALPADSSISTVPESAPLRTLNAFGQTPPSIDSNGTRLYSFLHPAKYNKNHCSVLLDYCCPNLDGPMAAIDPTRIHAQVQTVVREIPSYIVMKTELITRADLETNRGNIPASIRQKVEKITSGVSTVGTTSMAVTGNSGAASSLSPTLTALQNKLPATTTLTPKVLPTTKAVTKTTLNLVTTMTNSNAKVTMETDAMTSAQIAVGSPPPLTHFSSFMSPGALAPKPIVPTSVDTYQRNTLRSSWRRLDALLKKHGQRILTTSYLERGRCIETIVNENSPALSAGEVDTAERVLELFVNRLKTYSGGSSINTLTGAMSNVPQYVNSPTGRISTAAQISHSAMGSTSLPADTKNTKSLKTLKGVSASSGHGATTSARSSGRRNVPIYDSDQNIIGYQMQVVKCSVTASATAASPTMAVSQPENQTQRRVQQNTPKIFYTKTGPMQSPTKTSPTQSLSICTAATPTGQALSSSSLNSSTDAVLRNNTTNSTKRLGRGISIREVPLVTNDFPASTEGQHDQHQIIGKRTTRKTTAAAASATTTKIIVVSKNSGDGNTAQPEQHSASLSDECILPDDNNQNTEIKREQIDEDFISGN